MNIWRVIRAVGLGAIGLSIALFVAPTPIWLSAIAIFSSILALAAYLAT